MSRWRHEAGVYYIYTIHMFWLSQSLSPVPPWSHIVNINLKGFYWIQWYLYSWLWVMLMSVNVDIGGCAIPEAVPMLMTSHYYYIGILC